jgi:pimeloyl-ACP methyl ester carboxylesterase
MTNNINILLVHGAWADASSWSKVILLLRAKGYNVIAAQIPLTSLSDDIAVTRRMLADNKGPTILVGHSYGGAVITGAGTDSPDVKALVYITAFGLDEGESLASLAAQGPPSPGSQAVAPDQFGFLWINREKFHASFAADATDDEAAVMATVQRPLSVASFTDAETSVAWKTLPSWYLICTDDHMIPPPAQELMATRMKATVRKVASSHAPFISHPQDVVDIIVLAAESLK